MRRTREHIYRWIQGSVPERRCVTCRDWMPLAEYRFRLDKGAHNSECRACENVRRREYYARTKATA